MKATEQYFYVVLFIMLRFKLFKSVEEYLVCEHSKECYSEVLSRDNVYFAIKRDHNFLSLWIKP